MAITLEIMPPDEKPLEPAPPKTIVVRYGYMKLIGEFVSELAGKAGCGTRLVCRTERGTEIAEMLTTTCGNGGCAKSITRDKMLEYFRSSGGSDYPFTENGRILRVATAQDLAEQARLDENRDKDIKLARELVIQHHLPMKVVAVEYPLGQERVLFYFTSEQRIDFRQLVRDLAHHMHTRIELRQVGARDEARLTADYEKCGQHCCCKQFLKVLTPISMRSAKIQKATLDPAKISGRCGRLMCCLRYEDQTYEQLRKKLPKKNTRVKTEKGDGWVVDGQILTQLVLVQYDDFKREAVPLEKILAFDQPRPKLPDGRTMQSPNDRMPEDRLAPDARGARGAPASPGAPQRPAPGGPRQGPPAPAAPGAAAATLPPPHGGPRNAPKPPPRRPGGPQQQNQAGPGQPPRGPKPPLDRPRPGKPAQGPAGDPLARTGPTSGDLNTRDEIDDLIADALDNSPPRSPNPRAANPAAPPPTPPAATAQTPSAPAPEAPVASIPQPPVAPAPEPPAAAPPETTPPPAPPAAP